MERDQPLPPVVTQNVLEVGVPTSLVPRVIGAPAKCPVAAAGAGHGDDPNAGPAASFTGSAVFHAEMLHLAHTPTAGKVGEDEETDGGHWSRGVGSKGRTVARGLPGKDDGDESRVDEEVPDRENVGLRSVHVDRGKEPVAVMIPRGKTATTVEEGARKMTVIHSIATSELGVGTLAVVVVANAVVRTDVGGADDGELFEAGEEGRGRLPFGLLVSGWSRGWDRKPSGSLGGRSVLPMAKERKEGGEALAVRDLRTKRPPERRVPNGVCPRGCERDKDQGEEGIVNDENGDTARAVIRRGRERDEPVRLGRQRQNQKRVCTSA